MLNAGKMERARIRLVDRNRGTAHMRDRRHQRMAQDREYRDPCKRFLFDALLE